MVVQRLVRRTALEEEGWKRIPAVRRIFENAGYQVYYQQKNIISGGHILSPMITFDQQFHL